MISDILEIGYLIIKKIQMNDCKINVQQWSKGDILKSQSEFTEDLDRKKHPSLKTVSRTFYRGSSVTQSA